MSQTSPPPWRRDLAALLNPPLILSVSAESLSGAFVAGGSPTAPAPYLLAAASALIFASGGVFAAYFDRAAVLARNPAARPLDDETPVGIAWRIGWCLLLAGAALPALLGRTSALAAVAVALLVALHAAVTREVWGAGFLTLGAARGGNFILGLTANPEVTSRYWVAALPVALFVIALAIIQHSRQPGAPPTTGFMALVHGVAALAVLLYLSAGAFFYPVDALPFLFAALALTLPRLVKLIQDPRRPPAVEALHFGFLALTLCEACLAAGYAGVSAGILVALFCAPLYTTLRSWPVALVTQPR